MSARNSFLRSGFSFSICPSNGKVARFQQRDEPARLEHSEEELRRRRALEALAGREVLECRGPDVDAHLIAIVHERMHTRGFQQRQADLVTVAIERAGELLRDDRADAGRLERFGGQRTPRGAAEIAARDQQVSRPDLFWKTRIQRLEHEGRHFLRRFEHDVRGGQRIGGNVVAELPATPLKYPARRHVRPPATSDSRYSSGLEHTPSISACSTTHSESLSL